jgi:hypothetical protein
MVSAEMATSNQTHQGRRRAGLACGWGAARSHCPQ